MPKPQRLLDPIHGLIKFDSHEREQLIWRLLNCSEFQRLRRIKQLGFSEFVYPGATHTRFSHSIGVFQNARRLVRIIQEKMPDSYNKDRAFAVHCAALLHDIGHGPFSHTFEGVEKTRGVAKSHESWTVEIVTGDGEIGDVLRSVSDDFPNEVANVISGAEGGDIYASVVSSQFDADRLDYLRRDRYMTGIGSGDFDLEWLLDCLEVGDVTIGDADDFVEVPSFYLNHKGYKTAEGYLQARFQLYSMVYMHKTTRAAEVMLAALLGRLANLLKDNDPKQLGLPESDSVARYFSSAEPDRAIYLALDDAVLLTGIRTLVDCNDGFVSHLAQGLLDRKIYKCVDIGSRERFGSNIGPQFRKALRDRATEIGLEIGTTLLEDDGKIGGYSWYEWESENALKKVLVDDSEQNVNPSDIATTSKIVQSLMQERFYRVYVPENDDKEKIELLWKEIAG